MTATLMPDEEPSGFFITITPDQLEMLKSAIEDPEDLEADGIDPDFVRKLLMGIGELD